MRSDPQRSSYPKPELRVQQHRPKVYRVILHSDDRVAGTPTAATFDLGDLKGRWGLNGADGNLDAGTVAYGNGSDRRSRSQTHYLCSLETFHMQAAVSTAVEVRAEGFPMQRESFDSSSNGTSDLLGVAHHDDVTAWTNPTNGAFTLTELPGGRVTIRIKARRARTGAAAWVDVQAALDADVTVQWHLVLSITPQE